MKTESERIEEYLEAIYKQQIHGKPASTSLLAKDLKVSQPAVTDMLRSLESRGLVDYKPSGGATLTDDGMQNAVAVVRRHRLWERFLTDVMGIKWDKVHDEACKLEHATSPEVEEGLVKILGNVDTCPHGQSIPDKSGNTHIEGVAPLSELKPGQKVCILAVEKEEPQILQRVEKLGLKPKVIAKLVQKNEDGQIQLEIDGKKIWLDSALAEVLMARVVTDNELNKQGSEISLSKLSAGHSGVIKSYEGGKGMLGRCLSLGFTPGSIVKVLENFNRGPILVKVHDTEVALGRELADKIAVIRS